MYHIAFNIKKIRIEPTDGNFGALEKVAIPVPIFGTCVFPFPRDGNPVPMHISTLKGVVDNNHSCRASQGS